MLEAQRKKKSIQSFALRSFGEFWRNAAGSGSSTTAGHILERRIRCEQWLFIYSVFFLMKGLKNEENVSVKKKRITANGGPWGEI